MASIKKKYSFTNKRNIWRLIPSESGYLVIEERNMESKEVFFNCLKIDDGKVYFKNFQLEEKYWVGIEAVNKNIIFFHKFRKPDMPGHKGIYAFDILNKKIIWQNDDLIFLLAKDDNVFAYQTTFEGRRYFQLDFVTGKIMKDLGSEFDEINKIREELIQNDFTNNFLYPKTFIKKDENSDISKIFDNLLPDGKISGGISWLKLNDFVMFNYHEKNSDESFDNNFRVYDIAKSKIILNEKLNSKSSKMVARILFYYRRTCFFY